MKTRNLLAVAALLAAVIGVSAQPPAPGIRQPAMDPTPRSNVVPPAPVAETKPEELTAERLLEKVKQIRAQKAELDKQEKELMKVLTKKVDAMKGELDLLNGAGVPAAPIFPDAVLPGTAPTPVPSALPKPPR